MKVLLDACVLYPTVMREVLLGIAAEGLYQPFWSARILEEWARAAEREGLEARAEIAILRDRWSGAELPPAPGLEARLWLPDENDIHVLAVAVGGSVDAIMTMNAKDFPRGTLGEEGLMRIDPDGFLLRMLDEDEAAAHRAAARVLAQARRLSGEPWEMRALMKKARLPRFGKALAAA
ncbi:RSP_2648 family PIN domain-containing protein [Aestuariibius insulae]|uniref:RSP_2648 family PIN domain-containing protein n=1 Tax=Aestuariibius insulae TaxID=2058287 RepID=UPI00345EFBC3